MSKQPRVRVWAECTAQSWVRGVCSSALQEALSGLVSGFGVERCSSPPLRPSHSTTPKPPSTSSVLQALCPNFRSPASARDALEFPTGQRQHTSPSLSACPHLQGPLTAFQFPKLSPIVTSVLIWSKQKHLVQTPVSHLLDPCLEAGTHIHLQRASVFPKIQNQKGIRRAC